MYEFYIREAFLYCLPNWTELYKAVFKERKLALRLFMRTSSRKLSGTFSLLTANSVVEPEPWNLSAAILFVAYFGRTWMYDPLGPLDPLLQFLKIFYLFQRILKSVILTKLRKLSVLSQVAFTYIYIIIVVWVLKINVKKKYVSFLYWGIKVWPRKLRSLQISCFEF